MSPARFAFYGAFEELDQALSEVDRIAADCPAIARHFDRVREWLGDEVKSWDDVFGTSGGKGLRNTAPAQDDPDYSDQARSVRRLYQRDKNLFRVAEMVLDEDGARPTSIEALGELVHRRQETYRAGADSKRTTNPHPGNHYKHHLWLYLRAQPNGLSASQIKQLLRAARALPQNVAGSFVEQSR